MRAWITALVAVGARAGRRRQGAAAGRRDAASALPRALRRAQERARPSRRRRACRTTSTSCARSARSRARWPRRCASSASACSRCTSRRNVRGPASLRVPPCRRPATPAGRTSSSSGSRKGACSRRRPRTPCCSTRERAAISPELRLSTDRIDEAGVRACSRGSAASGPASSVTFSYSCRDTREFRETYASWLMLQAFRLQQGEAVALLSGDEGGARRAEVGGAGGPRRARSRPARWWLRSVVGTGDDGIAAVDAGVRRRCAADAAARGARQSATFTEFDGYVPGGGLGARSVRARNGAVGHRARERRRCPFRFFLKRGLGIRPVDERERDTRRLARSADARLGAARPLRRAAAPLPRRQSSP